MFDFLSIKRTMDGAAGRMRALNAKGADLRAQLSTITNSPPAKADVQAAVARWVEDMAAGFSQSMQSTLAALPQTPRDLVNSTSVMAVLSLIGEPTSRDEPALHRINQTLCALFGPQIKKVLASAVDAMQWPEGLPLAQREAALDRIDGEIDQVNAEQRDLRAAAQEAGIKL